MLLRFAIYILIALSAAGCPGTPQCTYYGDKTLPMTGELVQVLEQDLANGPAPTVVGATIPDGGPLLLSGAPQGGYVFYVGAFAANLDTCKVTLSGELLDPATGMALTNKDQRESDFTQITDNSYAAPADLFSDLPNIPACPGALGAGINGVPAILQITVTDDEGKSGTFQQAVTPVCPQTDARCPCECGPFDAGGC